MYKKGTPTSERKKSNGRTKSVRELIDRAVKVFKAEWRRPINGSRKRAGHNFNGTLTPLAISFLNIKPITPLSGKKFNVQELNNQATEDHCQHITLLRWSGSGMKRSVIVKG